MTLSVTAPRRHATWIGHLFTLVGVAAASYAAAVGTGALKRLAEGLPLDGSLLSALPIDPACYWFIPLVAVIFALEVLQLGWRASPLRGLLLGRSSSHRSDVFYLACDVFALTPILMLALTVGLSAAIERWLEIPRAWRFATDLPLWLAVPLFFLVSNFVVYWGHRFMHTPLMWPLHAVHHAAEEMTAATTFRHHPLDAFAGSLAPAIVAAFLAFPLDAVFVVEICSGIFTTILHTRLPVPAWFERNIVAGPRFHGIHHSADTADYCSNLSLLPIYDRLFGTFRWHEKPLRFGAGDARFDTGRPVHDIGAVLAIWLGGLAKLIAASIAKRRRVGAPA